MVGANAHDILRLGGSMYQGYHKLYGDNFVACGKVLAAEPQVMDRALTGPQGRGPHLHGYYLRPQELPTAHDVASSLPVGSSTFLLNLPNTGNPKEAHAMIRSLLFKYLLDEKAITRGSASDDYMAQLLSDFKAGYHAAKAAGNNSWDTSHLPELVLRWTHYALLGMKLEGDDFLNVWALYLFPIQGFPPKGVEHYFRFAGTKSVTRPDGKQVDFQELRATVTTLYESAPALAAWEDSDGLTRADFCRAFCPVMAIAAIQGPLSGALGILRGDWHGEIPKDFEVPYGDRDKLRLVILETQRIRPSVFGSTAEPLNDYAVTIGGERVVFPRGTPLILNYRTAGSREAHWPEPRDFDPYGRAEQLWGPSSSFWCFNSAGDRTHGDRVNGRICPGRDLGLAFLIDLLDATAPTKST